MEKEKGNHFKNLADGAKPQTEKLQIDPKDVQVHQGLMEILATERYWLFWSL